MLASAAIHPGAVSSSPCAVASSKRDFGRDYTGNFLEDFLGDVGSDLVLSDSIRVCQSVICSVLAFVTLLLIHEFELSVLAGSLFRIV
jgi:hypothetical protein